ncbi:MAG: tRNA preQ1(34) S-adenosylmethionine ribosyltransferase-isomerase QueA [Acidimicrobiales bacterium]
MQASELDYDLPPSAIAQVPVEPRDSARLLVDHGPGAPPSDLRVADLADMVGPDDLIVVNDTRVIPARLHLRKPTGGAVEVLLLERHPEGWWEALVNPSRRVAAGTRLTLDGGAVGVTPPDGEVSVEVGEVLGNDGRRRVQVHGDAGVDDLALLDQAGEVPLPPYIHEPLADPERYQTVYADRPGSVAAPTAGLHVTESLLDRCRAAGATVARVELVVGLGTFRPMATDRVEDHPMHAERYRIPPETLALLRAPGTVLAVGTTVVRALESWAATGAAGGSTELFIHGNYPFAVVDRLLTNFHVPRSSLLAMIESFVGPRWRDLYAHALANDYRFLSFGDAMLLTSPHHPPR